MKKKTMVSIVASSLLIAPMVLHQVAAADEQTEELAPSTEVVHAPSTEARPTTSDTNTVTSEEGTSSNEASLDRTAGANQVAPATERAQHKVSLRSQWQLQQQQTGKQPLNLLLLQKLR